ncbi:GNAT family N-acetyltransferase [Ekhidna sp.]
MDRYRVLSNQIFKNDTHQLVPIRYEDRKLIRQWRNEQMYHLRQNKLLSEEDQDHYFNSVVKSLFSDEAPNQLLFSYLKGNQCLGYGGLVHINWLEKSGEVSFVMNTQLEKEEFDLHWSTYLTLLEKVVFNELNFEKISTYAYDLRPHLYPVLEKNGFLKEAVLKNEVNFDGQLVNVVIHSKVNPSLKNEH